MAARNASRHSKVRETFPLEAAEFTGERPISRDGMYRFLTAEHLGEPPRESEVQGALIFANYVLSKGEPTKQESFSILFGIAERELAPRIARMAWAVEASPQRAFVTTDRPVAVWRRNPQNLKRMGVGLENADEVRFPLGPHHLLVLRPRYPEHHTVVEPERAAQVNHHLAAACYDIVIGRLADRTDLEQFDLRPKRPSVRFNVGPLVEIDAHGRSTPTDREILHMYTSYGDEVFGS